MKYAVVGISGLLVVWAWVATSVVAEPSPDAGRWAQLLGRSSDALQEAREGVLSLPVDEAGPIIWELLCSDDPSARDEGIGLMRRAPDTAKKLFGALIARTRSKDEVVRGTALRALSTLAPEARHAGHPMIKVLLPHVEEGGACSVYAFAGLIDLDLIDDRALDASHAKEVFEGLVEYDGLLYTPLAKTPLARKELLAQRSAVVVALLRAKDTKTRVGMLDGLAWFVRVTGSKRAFREWGEQVWQCFSDTSRDVRLAALNVVHRYKLHDRRIYYTPMGGRMHLAISNMVRSLDRTIRVRALSAAAQSLYPSSTMREALIDTIYRVDASAFEQSAAAWGLRWAGDDEGTVPALEHALKSPHHIVRTAAWGALADNGVVRPSFVRYAVDYARFAGRREDRGPYRFDRKLVERAFQELGAPLVQAFCEQLKGSEGDVRYRLLIGLVRCGPLGLIALRDLTLPLDLLRARIMRLAPVHMVPDEDMAKLFALLKDGDPETRVAAMGLLRKTPEATARLLRIAGQDDLLTRFRARFVLLKIGSWAKPAITEAIKECKDDDIRSELESLRAEIR